MGTKFDPRVGPADLSTDSVFEGFSHPSSGASVATVSPAGPREDGFKVDKRHEAPGAGIANPAGSRIRWVRDNAPTRTDAEPSQMDPFTVLAGFIRAGDARVWMLTRGAEKAGTVEVSSPDEPSMAELTRGKDVFDLFGSFLDKASSRAKDISKKS